MAVIAKQRYKLDIAPRGGWVIVYASQHDDGAREIEFEITNQGKAFSIPASINVSVQGIKSNGSYFSHSCSYSGNIVTMALADDMTDIIGKAICVLKFTNSSQQKLATAKFVLNVDIDASSEGIIIDTDAEEIFNQMLNDIRAQAASISADIAELQSMVGSPLVASTVSGMTDHNKIYVYTGSESGYTSGNWYYWNGSAWTSGGVYNSTAFETDKTFSVENMAADAAAVGHLLESTENIFNLNDFLVYGWTRTGDEVSGTLSRLSGVKFLDNYVFETATSYVLSFEAYTDGNASSGTENGLRVRIYYTDSTYSLITAKNNTLSYKFGAIVTDAAKTVDYIEIYYSNAESNIWHIRNIMLTKGTQITPFVPYKTSKDMIVRNKLSDFKNVISAAINQYVWDDLDIYATAAGWVLDGLGASKRDDNGQLVKYAVQAGQLLWINIDKHADAGVYQFQKSASVPSAGSLNIQLVGTPCASAVCDLVIVPEGATYLITTRSVNNPADNVKIVQFSHATLPAYWASYIDTKAREISMMASPPVGNGTRFIFITDVHLRNVDKTFRNAGYSPLLMQYLHEHCNIGYAFFGGDTLTTDYSSYDQAVSDLMLFMDTFSPVWEWMYSVFGNHEYATVNGSLSAMDKSIIYNALIRDKEHDYAAVNPVYGSYIMDNVAEKIRFICLNLNEGNNLTQQNDFFCSALRDTPSGWTIIFITHFTLENDGGTIKISTKLTNANSIIPAIEAYNARQVYGNYDFTTADAEVACVIGGHTHWDGMVKTSGGVPVIAVSCDMHTGITGMVLGTITEQCFDVFTIDTSAKTITTKRIGYGADRSFTYGN